VVITLLAVSAINSATLQERMASNQREKSRALQAADAGLRQGELLMRDPVFNDAQPPGSTVNVANPGQPAATVSLRLWRPGAFLGKDADGNPLSYDVDAGNDGLEPVRYYIEDYDCVGRDLNPDNRAKCDGSVIYRVTARATGENPAAVAVTQSLYEKRY
jgi:type IV pilus assembly protein PilX